MLVLRKLTATDDGIKKANQDGRQSNLCAGVREVGGVLRADIIDREAKVLPYYDMFLGRENVASRRFISKKWRNG